MLKSYGRAARALSLAAVVIVTAVAPLRAVDTRFWRQEDLADFEKGNPNKLSIRSDGRLFLAPVVSELLDSSTPYLWTIAQDSKGNLYAGGGGPTGSKAKLFQIDAAGKSKVLTEIDGLEIHAIAVDARDRVYAATAPDGKVYRVTNGKAEVFFDPHAKYIWAMTFSKSGDLFVATGDRGDIFKVTPDGKGSVFFKTEETHARSLAMDGNGNLIAGTEPGGLILKVTPAGEGFVLYQTPKREVTAVAVAGDGSIYAAGVGNKTAGAPSSGPAPAPEPPAPPVRESGAAPGGPTPIVMRTASAPPPSFATGAPSVTGGSEVYRISPDGAPRRIWSHAQDIAYALVINAQGRPLVGTGNKGNIYRLDTDLLYTLLVNLAPTQVTGFAAGSGGQLFAVTGNIGKLYRIGPDIEKSGTYQSDAFDAGAFTYWGRLSYTGSAAKGHLTFDARSGNVNHPQKNWTPWSPITLTGEGGRITAPPARFLQYRATLTGGSTADSPALTAVEVAYMPKNIAPVLSQIEVTPPNYRFAAASPLTLSTAGPQSITLPAIGSKKRATTAGALELTSGQSMQYAKGFIGARWAAQDDNSDVLTYRVEIRGEQETQWKLLKDKVREKYLSWDSVTYPDGIYVLRVIASDAPSNPPGAALTGQIVSDPFLIDNTPPQIIGLSASAAGTRLEIRWKAKDALSIIERAEYSVNGGEWIITEPLTRLSDAPELEYRLSIERPASGECTIAVRVADEYDNQAVEKSVVK